jgi:hypothetical protein
MEDSPWDKNRPNYSEKHGEIVVSCIEKLSIIALDIRGLSIAQEEIAMDPRQPETVVNFAVLLRAQLKQIAQNDAELSIQEAMIDSIENILNQLKTQP